MKYDQDLRLNLQYDFGNMNSTLGSVVPLAMFHYKFMHYSHSYSHMDDVSHIMWLLYDADKAMQMQLNSFFSQREWKKYGYSLLIKTCKKLDDDVKNQSIANTIAKHYRLCFQRWLWVRLLWRRLSQRRRGFEHHKSGARETHSCPGHDHYEHSFVIMLVVHIVHVDVE